MVQARSRAVGNLVAGTWEEGGPLLPTVGVQNQVRHL
jgi:hypothetical protein